VPFLCRSSWRAAETGRPFESAGYHIRDNKLYYRAAFPGEAVEINDADPATFRALDSTYGVDSSHVLVNGVVLPDADAASFELLDRSGLAKDHDHVYQRDHVLSDDPAHFELLDGELAKDSRVVYWSDGSVLSEDPAHFAIISDADHYLYTKGGSVVHVNGNPIADIDSATF
jgi:DKNYY family